MPLFRNAHARAAGMAAAMVLAASAAARADCDADTRAFLPLAKSEPNEIVRRAALAEATMAMDEAGDGSEADCQRYLASARAYLNDKPFRLAPGQTLAAPDDRHGVRPNRENASAPDAPADGG